MTSSRPRIVLAYSGSPAASAAVQQLTAVHASDVVTLTLDLGAGGEVQEIQERALALGAVRAHVLDVREEFADEYLLPALQAGALRGGGEIIDALARPLVAKKLVEIARIERAASVAHNALPDAGLETLIRALSPEMQVIGVPKASAVAVAAAARKPAAGVDAGVDNGADVEITFDHDVPIAINGVPMSLTELIESLTVIAMQHGLAPFAGFAGAPAITVLQAAFDGRVRGETTCVVRLKLQHGVTTAAAVQNSALAVPNS